MLFNSLPFLYFFLPISYYPYHLIKYKEFRYLWMTICGYVFYSFWNWKFTFLMLFSTVVSYFAGLGMLSAAGPRRRLFLVVPIAVDLMLLAFFKYANFALSTLSGAAQWLGIPATSRCWRSSCPWASRSIRSTRSRTSWTVIVG